MEKYYHRQEPLLLEKYIILNNLPTARAQFSLATPTHCYPSERQLVIASTRSPARQSGGCPATVQPQPRLRFLVSIWRQFVPTVPIWPVMPSHKLFCFQLLRRLTLHGMEEVVAHRTNGKCWVCSMAIRLHTTLEKQAFHREMSIFSGTLVQPLGDFAGARLQQSSRLTSVFGTGSTRESRLPLHGFQPQSNPKYHCSKCLYDSLALFETPNHAFQLLENTLLA